MTVDEQKDFDKYVEDMKPVIKDIEAVNEAAFWVKRLFNLSALSLTGAKYYFDCKIKLMHETGRK